MSRSTSDLLLSPLFVGALGAWAFNDHVLRTFAPGVLSGKLGDAASMIAFPILLAATLTPLTRLARVSERRVMDACALSTAALLAGIKFSEPVALVYRHALGFVQYAVGWASVYAPAAHTMDPTDVLVTPLALIPALAIRGRLGTRPTRSLVLVGLLSLLFSGCATGRSAGAWRGDISVRAHGGLTESSQFYQFDTVTPVAGDVVGTHRASVVGASADTSFRVARRGVVGGTVSVASGWVSSVDADYERFGAYVDRFVTLALGPTFGIYGERVLIRGGAVVMLGIASGPGVGPGRALALPYVRIEPGRPDRVHPVFQVGSADGFTWDGRAVAAGLSIPFLRGQVAFGYAIGSRLGPDLHGSSARSLSFANRGVTPFESYGWLELVVSARDSLNVLFSIQGGRQLPVASLGLRWELDRGAHTPPNDAFYPGLPLPATR